MLQKLQEKAVIDWNNYLTKQEVQKFLSKDDKTESAEEIIYSKEFKPRYNDLHNDLQKKYNNSWNRKELIQDLVQFYNFGNLITECKEDLISQINEITNKCYEDNNKLEESMKSDMDNISNKYKDYLLYPIETWRTKFYPDNRKSGYIRTFHAVIKNPKNKNLNTDIFEGNLEKLESEIQRIIDLYYKEDKLEESNNNKLILYHNTTNENAIKINKEGILPGLRINAYGKGSEAEGNGIWCSTVRGYGYGGATITFKVNADDPYLYKANDTEYVVYRKIEPQEIIDIDLMISDIPCNYKRTDTINSTVESDIPSAIKDWGKDKLLQVFSNNSKHFAQPYNTEQLKTLIETGNKYCKGTIQMESKLNESKFILRGTMNGSTFDVASSNNKQGLERFKQEMTPGNPNVTFWIEENTGKVTEGIHLYGFITDENGARIREDTNYNTKAEYEKELKANGYKVKRVNDNRDMYILNHSDYRSISDAKRRIKELQERIKQDKERKMKSFIPEYEQEIKQLQELIDEANKIPLTENVKTRLIDTNKLPNFYTELESRSDSDDYITIWKKLLNSKTGRIRCNYYELDCISSMYEDYEDYSDIHKLLYGVSLNEGKLEEKSRNELLAKTKMQTKTRYEKSDSYRGFGFKGVDTSNLLTDNTLPVVCRVGDYEDTVELQDVLYWIQEQAKRNSNNKVDNHTVRDAILQAIDAMDIKVDCTCPDFAYRMAYQASEGGYKYGKQETRPANITNPMNYGALCKHLTAMLSNKKWLQKVAAPVMNWMDEHIEDVNKFLRARPGEELVLPNETARTLGKAGAISKQQNRKQRLLDILKDFIRNRRNFILRNVNDDRELREGIKAYIKHEYTSEDGKIDYLKVDETELDFLLDELNKWLVSKGYKQIQKDEPEQEENTNTQEETNPEESEE